MNKLTLLTISIITLLSSNFATAMDNNLVPRITIVGLSKKDVNQVAAIIYPRHCANCFTDETPSRLLKMCTGCGKKGYCNTTCQRSDWGFHKRICDYKKNNKK
jgi:hypothetical protein